jgi:hypothetical protein
VISCSDIQVVAEGPAAFSATAGELLVSYGDETSNMCDYCAPLFHKITGIVENADGTITFETSFATFGEIWDPSLYTEEAVSAEVEPSIGCDHSFPSGSERSLQVLELEAFIAGYESRELQSTCAATYLVTDSDGNCIYTNCHVGKDGNPVDCFECGATCDNGCGKDGSKIFVWDGEAYAFDFGPACCHHDHCYSMYDVFSKAQCDFDFWARLRDACPFEQTGFIGFLIYPLNKVQMTCQSVALAMYGLVVAFGDDAADKAVARQKAHEKTDTCIEQCPSTRESGGRGTYRFRLDMVVTEGTFPVSYYMYSIPDQLTITYEGSVLFDTGKLVSGGSSFSLSYSGSTKYVDVIMTAPNSGTAWDLFVGCPDGVAGGSSFSISAAESVPILGMHPEKESDFLDGAGVP